MYEKILRGQRECISSEIQWLLFTLQVFSHFNINLISIRRGVYPALMSETECMGVFGALTHLLLQLCELTRQVRDELHSGFEFLLQVPDLILFPFSIAAHQRHGPHSRKPVQIVILFKNQYVSKGIDDDSKNEVEDDDDDHEEKEQNISDSSSTSQAVAQHGHDAHEQRAASVPLTKSFIGYPVDIEDEIILEDNVAYNGEEIDQDEGQYSSQHDGATVPGHTLDYAVEEDMDEDPEAADDEIEQMIEELHVHDHGFVSSRRTLTLKAPRRKSVGSSPTENMRRNMVEAMSARIPCGCGSTITIARETNMANHSNAERQINLCLTSTHPFQRIEESYQQVHENGQIEGDAAPKRHVPGTPVFRTQKEVVDLAPLFISLCGVIYTKLGFLCQEFTYVRDRKDDLFHERSCEKLCVMAIVDGPTDLNLSRVFGIELQSFIPLPICPSWFQHGLEFLVVSGQLWVFVFERERERERENIHMHLVLMAGALTVFSQALHSLVDQSYVLLIDVEPQQPQASCGAAADTVQELQRLTHQVIVVLVVLTTKEVLGNKRGEKQDMRDMLLCYKERERSYSMNRSRPLIKLELSPGESEQQFQTVQRQQLHEAQDWLHDGDDDTHLILILVLVPCAALSLSSNQLIVGGNVHAHSQRATGKKKKEKKSKEENPALLLKAKQARSGFKFRATILPLELYCQLDLHQASLGSRSATGSVQVNVGRSQTVKGQAELHTAPPPSLRSSSARAPGINKRILSPLSQASVHPLTDLDDWVSSFQQSNGQQDALLEDSVTCGVHDEIDDQAIRTGSVGAMLLSLGNSDGSTTIRHVPVASGQGKGNYLILLKQHTRSHFRMGRAAQADEERPPTQRVQPEPVAADGPPELTRCPGHTIQMKLNTASSSTRKSAAYLSHDNILAFLDELVLSLDYGLQELEILDVAAMCLDAHLFESHENFLSLTEVSKEQMKSSRHKRWIVVHGEVQKNPQKSPATMVIQIQREGNVLKDHVSELSFQNNQTSSSSSSDSTGPSPDSTSNRDNTNLGQAREGQKDVSDVPYPAGEVSADLGTAGGGSRARRTHLTHLSSQVMSSGQVLKPKQTVPVTSTTTAGVMLNHLRRKMCFAAGGRGGRLAASGSQKHMLLLPVFITAESNVTRMAFFSSRAGSRLFTVRVFDMCFEVTVQRFREQTVLILCEKEKALVLIRCGKSDTITSYKNTKPSRNPFLNHTTLARLTAGTEGIALEHRLTVLAGILVLMEAQIPSDVIRLSKSLAGTKLLDISLYVAGEEPSAVPLEWFPIWPDQELLKVPRDVIPADRTPDNKFGIPHEGHWVIVWLWKFLLQEGKQRMDVFSIHLHLLKKLKFWLKAISRTNIFQRKQDFIILAVLLVTLCLIVSHLVSELVAGSAQHHEPLLRVASVQLVHLGVIPLRGLMTEILISTGLPPVKNITVAYKFKVGPYKDCGLVFRECSRLGPKLPSVGIFYDDPKKWKKYLDVTAQQEVEFDPEDYEMNEHFPPVYRMNALGTVAASFLNSPSSVIVPAQNCRSALGSILSEGEDGPSEEQKQLYVNHGFQVFTFPEVIHVVTTSFPHRTPLSIFLGVQRVYPQLNYYIKHLWRPLHICLPRGHFWKPCRPEPKSLIVKGTDRDVENLKGWLDDRPHEGRQYVPLPSLLHYNSSNMTFVPEPEGVQEHLREAGTPLSEVDSDITWRTRPRVPSKELGVKEHVFIPTTIIEALTVWGYQRRGGESVSSSARSQILFLAFLLRPSILDSGQNNTSIIGCLTVIQERKLCAHPFLEIYRGGLIHFMSPLARQGDFYVPEAREAQRWMFGYTGTLKKSSGGDSNSERSSVSRMHVSPAPSSTRTHSHTPSDRHRHWERDESSSSSSFEELEVESDDDRMDNTPPAITAIAKNSLQDQGREMMLEEE
ncbi:hypothetical protein DNTS_032985 [Danionella cerebrum]|uniref:Uncharacterized protein n=1 Tax=Danionella cerebrum TaxID=2873325 RepID=A0A553QY41_9TELE|nr:hypothetical protein DNTS_032985 [Danionella translucida]